MENITLSNNNLTVDFDYPLETSQKTIPGNRTIPIPLNILTAANGETIAPTFESWLVENSAVKQTVTDKTVTVSAAAKYNIELRRNNNVKHKVTETIDGKNRVGRVYAIGAILELDNRRDQTNKGVKGLEVPTG